jgi:serine O-acetyltransferase
MNDDTELLGICRIKFYMTAFDLTKNSYDWGIESLVLHLSALRKQSQGVHQRQGRSLKLPSRNELSTIIDNLSSVLFPNQLNLINLSEEGIDYFVGQTLSIALSELHKQICYELQFNSENASINGEIYQQAITITRQFALKLPEIKILLDTDIQAAYEGDPAARTPDEILVCYPGIIAIIHHRLAHELFHLGVPMIARLTAELAHSATGIDIHPGAKIDKSFFIDHGTGVVIGETTIIGNRVRLYQNVTLGAKCFLKAEDGTLIKGYVRHPIVEDDVVIYAGATILGRITIGHNSIIGGNVWLTHSVPPYSHISQAKEHSQLSQMSVDNTKLSIE